MKYKIFRTWDLYEKWKSKTRPLIRSVAYESSVGYIVFFRRA